MPTSEPTQTRGRGNVARIQLTNLPNARAHQVLIETRAVAKANGNALATAGIVLVTDKRSAYAAEAKKIEPRYRAEDLITATEATTTWGSTAYGLDEHRKHTAVVFVSPELSPAATEETLVHELCHAFSGRKMGHNYSWRRLLAKAAAEVMFAGKPAQTEQYVLDLVVRYTQRKLSYRRDAAETRGEYATRVRVEAADLLGRVGLHDRAAALLKVAPLDLLARAGQSRSLRTSPLK